MPSRVASRETAKCPAPGGPEGPPYIWWVTPARALARCRADFQVRRVEDVDSQKVRPLCVLRVLGGNSGRVKYFPVASWDDVVAIARQLPSTEVSTWYGTPGLKVAGKGFARLRTESDGGLVLMCSLEE